MSPMPSPAVTRRLALFAGVGLFLAACGGTSTDDTSSPATDTTVAAQAADAAPTPEAGTEGATAPGADGGSTAVPASLAFTATTLDGATFDGAGLAGTDAVAWFWAPWCTTCRAEAPDVAEVAAAYDGRVQLLGVGGRGEVAEMEGFVAETGTDGLTHVVDESGDIWAGFDVFAQPAFAFIDDDGSVTVHVGTLGGDGLRDRIDELLAT